jgi:hypothetical protein
MNRVLGLFPRLAERFSAMYIRNVSRQIGLDFLSYFQQPLRRPKPSEMDDSQGLFRYTSGRWMCVFGVTQGVRS